MVSKVLKPHQGVTHDVFNAPEASSPSKAAEPVDGDEDGASKPVK